MDLAETIGTAKPAMKIKTRLMSTLLLCSIIPTLSVGFLSYQLSQNAADDLKESAGKELQQQAEQGLQAVAFARRLDLQHYFDGIAAQLTSLAKMPSIAESIPKLGTALTELTTGLPTADIEAARAELARYYTGDFDAEYRRQVPGASSGISGALGQLDGVSVMGQLQWVQRNPHPLGKKHELVDCKDSTTYSQLHAALHEQLVAVQQAFGYYDLFLIDPSGRVVYSVFKELDFATSLANGPWARTNLGDLFRALPGTGDGKIAFADFTTYKPSYDGPAGFAGTPIAIGGQRVGYLVIQLPIDRMNAVATPTEGLGKTGEVTLIGPDLLMRSDSVRHNPKTHTVVASFRNPQAGAVRIPEVKEALAGKQGAGLLRDDDGKEEIGVWMPIEVFGTRWAMLAKGEMSEYMAGATTLHAQAEKAAATTLWWSLATVLGVCIGVGALSWFLASQQTAPINRTVAALKDIAEGEGDLRARLDETRADELGELGLWFNRFLAKLQKAIGSIAEKATGVSAASAQLTSTAQTLAETAERTKSQTSQAAAASEEMSANMKSVHASSDTMTGTFRTVAAAVEEMTASIAEVAKSADNAAKVAGTAAQLTRSSNEKVSALGAAANEIGRVIETIQDIAEQTNLLALNATIEAARAGEAGKGFSVVANEVKDLARQTADATMDIRKRIERIQASTTESVQAIAAIDQIIVQVNESSQAIAASVAEQRSATQEISSNLAQSTRTVDTVARNVTESVTASQEISRSIAEVDNQARSTAAAAEETSVAGKAMADLARELQTTVGQFKI